MARSTVQVKSTALGCGTIRVVDPSTGRRARRRAEVTEAILHTAREHLSTHGAAALSLRAVARDLGMVSSAVYRYVADRDALLTLLLVEAYTEVADAVDSAVADAADRPWDARVLAAARVFRAWAVADPARYALLYGSPVPGYAAPPEATLEPGTRVLRTLVALVAEGVAAGEVSDTPRGEAAPAALLPDLGRVGTDLGLPDHPDVLLRTLRLWAELVGVVSLEVFGQFGDGTFTEPALLSEHGVRVALGEVRGAPDRAPGSLAAPTPARRAPVTVVYGVP
jgi:AcrR family transcriptional regulator